jgi:hypothetical protein
MAMRVLALGPRRHLDLPVLAEQQRQMPSGASGLSWRGEGRQRSDPRAHNRATNQPRCRQHDAQAANRSIRQRGQRRKASDRWLILSPPRPW